MLSSLIFWTGGSNSNDYDDLGISRVTCVETLEG